MKTKLLIICIIHYLLIGNLLGSAQEKIGISVYQDAKFLVLGDEERGYKKATINIVARLKMQGKQQDYGYMVVFPEFEYADIKGIYKRYSLNVGYTFNNLMLDHLEASTSIGFGFIDRYSKNFTNYSVNAELSYLITPDLKLALMFQLTQRKDLGWLWDETVMKPSGFIGLEANVFKIKKRDFK